MIRVFIVMSFFVFPFSAFGDIYHWTDEKGVFHMTDDMTKVPEEYRKKIKTIKTEPEGPSPPPAISPQRAEEKKEELYGDYPLSWWRAVIGNKKKEIISTKEEYVRRKQFTELFERGRYEGAIFGEEDAKTYERYKEDMPRIEKKIGELEKELEDLRDKARRAGVPKKMRE